MKILSRRAQDFLNSPQYCSKGYSSSSHSISEWEFEFQNDNILTLSYFTDSLVDIEKLFMEALSRLAIGRNILFLQNLSFREIENYLRDENHLPVFEMTGALIPELVYLDVKNSLISSIVINKLADSIGFQCEVLGPWSNLTLVERNKLALKGIELLNSLFPKQKPMKLALAEETEIALVMNEFPLSVEVIELVFLSLFTKSEEKTSLKVVAVQ